MISHFSPAVFVAFYFFYTVFLFIVTFCFPYFAHIPSKYISGSLGCRGEARDEGLEMLGLHDDNMAIVFLSFFFFILLYYILLTTYDEMSFLLHFFHYSHHGVGYFLSVVSLSILW